MENTQIIAERIKQQAKNQNVHVKDVLEFIKVDRNLVNKLANGKDTGTQNLLKIANYLGCSTDYLFGRVDNPTGSYFNGNNSVQLVNSNNVGNNSSVTINDAQKQDTLTDEFIEIFGKLSFTEKVKVMNFVADMMKSEV